MVAAFSPRMVCTGCGIVGADARPTWQEQRPRESLIGDAVGPRLAPSLVPRGLLFDGMLHDMLHRSLGVC